MLHGVPSQPEEPMNFKTLILSLTLLSTTAFAQQKIHPDLDVPTVDFRKFEQQQRSIKETLDDIEFYSEGEIDALSVSIPDYKAAATNFNNYASAVLSDYNNGLEDIKTEALLGSKDISELQAEYSAKLILWAAPAPFPVLVSPNMWCNDAEYSSCRGFWSIMGKAKDAVAVKPKKEAYRYAMETVSDALFTDCKTASCAYELGKGYKNFFLKVIKLNKDLKIGDEKLESKMDIKKRKIKKLLKDAINYAAAKRPSAVYTKHEQN